MTSSSHFSIYSQSNTIRSRTRHTYTHNITPNPYTSPLLLIHTLPLKPLVLISHSPILQAPLHCASCISLNHPHTEHSPLPQSAIVHPTFSNVIVHQTLRTNLYSDISTTILSFTYLDLLPNTHLIPSISSLP